MVWYSHLFKNFPQFVLMLTNWYMPNVLEPRDIEKIKKGGREVQEGGAANSLSCTAKTLQHYKQFYSNLKKKRTMQVSS